MAEKVNPKLQIANLKKIEISLTRCRLALTLYTIEVRACVCEYECVFESLCESEYVCVSICVRVCIFCTSVQECMFVCVCVSVCVQVSKRWFCRIRFLATKKLNVIFLHKTS